MTCELVLEHRESFVAMMLADPIQDIVMVCKYCKFAFGDQLLRLHA